MENAYCSGGFLELTDSINQKIICCPIDLLSAKYETNQNVVISLKDSQTHESDPSEYKAKDVS